MHACSKLFVHAASDTRRHQHHGMLEHHDWMAVKSLDSKPFYLCCTITSHNMYSSQCAVPCMHGQRSVVINGCNWNVDSSDALNKKKSGKSRSYTHHLTRLCILVTRRHACLMARHKTSNQRGEQQMYLGSHASILFLKCMVHCVMVRPLSAVLPAGSTNGTNGMIACRKYHLIRVDQIGGDNGDHLNTELKCSRSYGFCCR